MRRLPFNSARAKCRSPLDGSPVFWNKEVQVHHYVAEEVSDRRIPIMSPILEINGLTPPGFLAHPHLPPRVRRTRAYVRGRILPKLDWKHVDPQGSLPELVPK